MNLYNCWCSHLGESIVRIALAVQTTDAILAAVQEVLPHGIRRVQEGSGGVKRRFLPHLQRLKTCAPVNPVSNKCILDIHSL